MIYDLALFIDGSKTLTEVNAIFEKLDDIGIDVDFGTLDFQDDGLYMDAGYNDDEIKELEKAVTEIGAEIDWNTMADWGGWEEEEEEEK